MARTHLTLADVAGTQEDKDLIYQQFLDDFYHADTHEKVALIKNEPKATGEGAFDAKLAATAELLAHRYNLAVPNWCNKDRFFSTSPVWGLPTVCENNSDAQTYFKDTTPIEFAKRNLFYGGNLLRRV